MNSFGNNTNEKLYKKETVGCNSSRGAIHDHRYDQNKNLNHDAKRALCSYQDKKSGNNWWWHSNNGATSKTRSTDSQCCLDLGYNQADQVRRTVHQPTEWQTSKGQTDNWRAREKQPNWKKPKEINQVSHHEYSLLQQENLKLKKKLWKQTNKRKRLRAKDTELKGNLMLLLKNQKKQIDEQLKQIIEINFRIDLIEQKKFQTNLKDLHLMIESLKKDLELKTTKVEKQKYEIETLKENLNLFWKEETLKKELQESINLNSSLKLQLQLYEKEIEQMKKCSEDVLNSFFKSKDTMEQIWKQDASQNYEQFNNVDAAQNEDLDNDDNYDDKDDNDDDEDDNDDNEDNNDDDGDSEDDKDNDNSENNSDNDDNEEYTNYEEDKNDKNDKSNEKIANQSDSSFEELWQDVIQSFMNTEQTSVDETMFKKKPKKM